MVYPQRGHDLHPLYFSNRKMDSGHFFFPTSTQVCGEWIAWIGTTGSKHSMMECIWLKTWWVLIFFLFVYIYTEVKLFCYDCLEAVCYYWDSCRPTEGEGSLKMRVTEIVKWNETKRYGSMENDAEELHGSGIRDYRDELETRRGDDDLENLGGFWQLWGCLLLSREGAMNSLMEDFLRIGDACLLTEWLTEYYGISMWRLLLLLFFTFCVCIGTHNFEFINAETWKVKYWTVVLMIMGMMVDMEAGCARFAGWLDFVWKSL